MTVLFFYLEFETVVLLSEFLQNALQSSSEIFSYGLEMPERKQFVIGLCMSTFLESGDHARYDGHTFESVRDNLWRTLANFRDGLNALKSLP